MFGPIQVVVFRFDTIERFQGEILEQLDELTDSPAVRVLDALFVAKDEGGDLLALEVDDLPEDDALGTLLGALLGFSFEGDDPQAPPGEITEASAIGVTVDDVRRIGRDLAPGTGAALFLIEHRWAKGLRDALRDAGGTPMIQGFLTLEGLTMIGAELAATIEAVAAVEVADALEAEATLRSLEALATIELADEIEAAVVARTVRELVEAGFLEQAIAEDAVAALIDQNLLEQASQ